MEEVIRGGLEVNGWMDRLEDARTYGEMDVCFTVARSDLRSSVFQCILSSGSQSCEFAYINGRQSSNGWFRAGSGLGQSWVRAGSAPLTQ